MSDVTREGRARTPSHGDDETNDQTTRGAPENCISSICSVTSLTGPAVSAPSAPDTARSMTARAQTSGSSVATRSATSAGK